MNKNKLLQDIQDLSKEYLTDSQMNELLHSLSNQSDDILKKISMDQFNYCELHVHSEYSLLNGVGSIDDNIKRAHELGHKSLAITDENVTHGWFKLRSASNYDIKPIFGCEINVFEHNLLSRCILIAMNNEGYRNILKIVSKSHLDSASVNHSVTKQFISQHSEGVIVTTSSIDGILNHMLNHNFTYEQISVETEWWIENFPNRLYLEIQNYELNDHSSVEEYQLDFIRKQNNANDMIIKLANQFNLPLICTNDVHYPIQGEHVTQDILLCIKHKTKLHNPDRIKANSNLHYMKNKWEMLWRFRDQPESVFNTQILADRCEITYQKDYLLPTSPDVPENVDSITFLRNQTYEGLKKFYSKKENMIPLLEKFKTDENSIWKMIKERTEHEINVFGSMGFEGYVLIVSWGINKAEEIDIIVGPGRGSSAGSIVALGLNIVKVCPLRYDLLFERFLNPERISMPDFDVDIEDVRRGELIELFKNELGEEHLSQIVTFGRLMARAATRDAGRVLNTPPYIIDKTAKLIPFNTSLQKTLETVSEFRNAYEKEPEVKKLIDHAFLIEGKLRNHSVHAAGVILSNEDISNHVSLQTGNSAVLPVAQIEMNDVDGTRLVKQDFLGLTTLSVIGLAKKLIEKRHGVIIKSSELNINDKKTFELLSSGKTVACFQLESKGMRELLKDINIEKLEDVIDCIAIYRPGVLSSGMHKDYVRNKFNPSQIQYLHPILEEVLSPSRGIMIYQEQAMLIASKCAGFSMAKADELRSAISKKKEDKMKSLKPDFFEGCKVISNMTQKTIEDIWYLTERMADYSFPKAHAVSYGYISYETAYLKANYPLEYMTAAIAKAASKKSTKVPLYIEEAKSMGFEVLSPSINLSDSDFTIYDDKIIFGLRAIRDVGKISFEIVNERIKNGPFKDIIDFRRRLPKVNKKVLTSLIKSGCFDTCGVHRNRLLPKLDELMEIKPLKSKKTKNTSNIMLPNFDELDSNNTVITFPDVPEPTKEELIDIEDEMFGIFILYHPLAPHKESLDKQVSILCEDFNDGEVNQEVYVGGFIRECKCIKTKKGADMAIYTIDDLTGTYNVVAFPRQYKKMKDFKEKHLVLLKGKIDFKEKISYDSSEDNMNEEEYEVQIIAEEMVRFTDDAVSKLTPLAHLPRSLKSYPKESTVLNVPEEKTLLSEYLKAQGNKKLIIY